MTNNDIVELTKKVLAENPQWKTIYQRYAKQIFQNSEHFVANARKFMVKAPIIPYSSLGKVMSDDSSTHIDLRFAGQSIGNISINNNGVRKLYVSAEQAKYAKEHFGYEQSKELKGILWEDATDWRRYFYSLESKSSTCIKSEEHRIESFLLKEFAKTTRKQDKKLCNIQPVRMGGKFFQLTTPLKASTHEPTISLTTKLNGANGGGIDILATVKHSPRVSRFAIMELKDENRENECQEVAMFQAITYATFFALLLRSESGRDWWNILKNKGKITETTKINDVPNHLDIDVVTIMPVGVSKEGDLSPIELNELNTTLHLYTLYYNKDAEGNPASFVGTLSDNLLL